MHKSKGDCDMIGCPICNDQPPAKPHRCPYCDQRLPANFDKRALKHERQRQTMRRMVEAGIDIGRPKKISKGDDGYIRNLKTNGMSVDNIARAMNISRATVWRSLQRTKR